ncbi:uncharacterized protein LOC143018423 [Oratosquilla oratoria]|uniref:uncharacterized protein LOC143018423 n=1 Tax=Oratosquilla oratoria TaxID=337810 RepID=UPI003F7698F5
MLRSRAKGRHRPPLSSCGQDGTRRPLSCHAVLVVAVMTAALAALAPGVAGDDYCKPHTLWIERTEYRNVPIVRGNKQQRDFYQPVYVTQTILQTHSKPYFVTQTQHVPQYQTRVATLPQYITHTVFKTLVKSLTKTEKTYHTVYATRKQKIYQTVCPKGYH